VTQNFFHYRYNGYTAIIITQASFVKRWEALYWTSCPLDTQMSCNFIPTDDNLLALRFWVGTDNWELADVSQSPVRMNLYMCTRH
jgi:hypothetical protein